MLRIGCFLPTYGERIEAAALLDFARRAEALGFDHLWTGDHYLWNTGMLAPAPALAAVAAVTSRIRLGTGVYLLNLRHPTITAKDMATVDLLSGGRLILGVGAGGDDPREYEAVGLRLGHRGRHLEESLGAIRGLFSQDGGAFHGELVHHPAFTMKPPPAQGHVPVWIGGRAQAVVERAADVGDGWFPVWVSPSRFRSARDTIEERRGSLGDFALALNVFVGLADSREAAHDIVADHMQAAYALPFDKFERYAAYGSADDVLEALQPYVDAGMTDIALNLTGPGRLELVERLAEEVTPRLREATVPRG